MRILSEFDAVEFGSIPIPPESDASELGIALTPLEWFATVFVTELIPLDFARKKIPLSTHIRLSKKIANFRCLVSRGIQ